jgi:hypothetical protein
MMEKSSTRSDGRDDDLISFQPSSSGTNTEFDQNTLQDERDETKEVHRLAASETAHIRFWRLVVVALLLVSGAVLSTFTYIFLRGEEKDDYVDAYYLFANTIRDVTRFRVENMFEAFQGLAETLTAHAIVKNLTFPFVSLPMFEVAGRHTLAQSRNELLFFTPFVTGDQKEEWEGYAWENQGWLGEGRSIRLENDQTLQTTSFLEGNITPQIFEFATVSPPGRDVYSPVWQMSPVPFSPSIQNFDFRSSETNAFVMDAMQIVKGTIFCRTLSG